MRVFPNSKVGSTPLEVIRFWGPKAPTPYMIPPTQRPQNSPSAPAGRPGCTGGCKKWRAERARGRSEAEQQGPEDSRKFWGRGGAGAAAAAAGPGLRRPAVGGQRRETPKDKGAPQRLRGDLTWRQERPERLPAVPTLLLPRAAQLSGRGSPLALL